MNGGRRRRYADFLRDDLVSLRDERGAAVALGHVCKGIQDMAGSLRLSEVIVEPAVEPARTKIAALAQDPNVHKRVFRAHIRRFGRQSTLLHWLALFTYQNAHRKIAKSPLKCATAVFSLRSRATTPIKLLKSPPSRSRWNISLSREFLDVLVPDRLIEDYLISLYKSIAAGHGEAESATLPGFDWRWPETLLLGSQANALMLASAHPQSLAALKTLTSVYFDENGVRIKDARNAWTLQFLGALQLAFLYVRGFVSENLRNDLGFISVGCLKPSPVLGDDNTLRSPVAVISLPLENDRESLEKTIIDTIGGGHLRIVLESQESSLDAIASTSDLRTAEGSEIERVREDLQECVRKAVPSPAISEWPTIAAPWLALLLSVLRGSVHEGLGLDFVFVMADVSQLTDSLHFELLPLRNCALIVPPPRATGRSRERQKQFEVGEVRRQIAKENYCWFTGGRYALLWDITFPENSPQYLVRLRESSWNLFVAACRDGQPPNSAKDAIVVAYLQSNATGGVIIRGSHEFSLSRSGKWFRRGEGLRLELLKYMEAAAGDILSGEDISKLAVVLELVSSDPHLGCMVVLLEEDGVGAFQTMGEPWEFGSIDEAVVEGAGRDFGTVQIAELAPLLGMDGAACVWRGPDGRVRIVVRRLVTAPEERARTLSMSSAATLSGEGSRKWSASLAATRREVRLVIAVSQDGPVYIYGPASILLTLNKEKAGELTPEETDKDHSRIVMVEVLSGLEHGGRSS